MKSARFQTKKFSQNLLAIGEDIAEHTSVSFFEDC